MIKPTDILQIRGTKWFYNGRELTDAEKKNLKSEAVVITQTALWKMVVAEGKYHAQKRAIIDAQTIEELKEAQEFHKVVVLFEQFINTIINK